MEEVEKLIEGYGERGGDEGKVWMKGGERKRDRGEEWRGRGEF